MEMTNMRFTKGEELANALSHLVGAIIRGGWAGVDDRLLGAGWDWLAFGGVDCLWQRVGGACIFRRCSIIGCLKDALRSFSSTLTRSRSIF
jgi:hypothetical protein